jgi:DNA-binding GntR family transcriptional regulator
MSLGQISGAARTRTVHEYVLKSLREAIMDGRLSGGTHLVQTELAAQLDVSITPVREALRDLATEGLVVFDPHRGALVRTLDLEEVREIYSLRTLLEPVMVRRIIELIPAEQLDRADDLRRRMEQLDDLSTWVELNRQFHACFSGPDQSSRLSSIISGLRDSAAAYVSMSLSASPDRVAESNREHARLVELYQARDTEGVVGLTLQHLNSTLSAIEEGHARGLLAPESGTESPRTPASGSLR